MDAVRIAIRLRPVLTENDDNGYNIVRSKDDENTLVDLVSGRGKYS